MKIRIARHTNNLSGIIEYYNGLLGLDILGKFTGHNNYDGIFLGTSGCNWHLEFTSSNEIPKHKADEDDMLVFYFDSQSEYLEIIKKFKNKGIEEVLPKNPYWKENGIMFKDPDGFLVVLSLERK